MTFRHKIIDLEIIGETMGLGDYASLEFQLDSYAQEGLMFMGWAQSTWTSRSGYMQRAAIFRRLMADGMEAGPRKP